MHFILSSWSLRFSLIGCCLILISCASQTKERSAASNGVFQGEQGVLYDIPVSDPSQGEVRIQAIGVTTIQKQGHREKLPALHMRMTIHNAQAPEPWHLDSRNQIISFTDDGELRPSFVHSSIPTELPLVQIAKGITQVIDLYYILPEGRATLQRVPGFTWRWQVQLGNELMTRATAFKPTGRNDEIIATTISPEPPAPRPRRAPASQSVDESDWWMDPFSSLPYPWIEDIP